MSEEFIPQAEPRSHDLTLVGDSASAGCIVAGVIGLILGGIGSGVILAVWSDGEIGGLVVGGVFALLGLLCLVGSLKQFLTGLKLDRASVCVSASPIYLGEEFRGEFTQRVKKAATINSVSISLICREWVEYTRGTDTSTETHDVFKETKTLDVSEVVEPPDCIRGAFTFQISEEAMHSFEATHNRVDWLLVVKTDVAGWPDYQSDIKLSVAARYAESEV